MSKIFEVTIHELQCPKCKGVGKRPKNVTSGGLIILPDCKLCNGLGHVDKKRINKFERNQRNKFGNLIKLWKAAFK